MKKRLVLLTALTALSISTTPVLAQYETPEILNDIETIEVLDDQELNNIYEELTEFSALTRGKKPPTGTSFLSLANNVYNYNVKKLTVEIFSDTLFSGVKNMNVKVDTINVDKNGMKNTSKGITVNLYNSKKKHLASKSIGLNGGTVKFTGLDTKTKYYVSFSKSNDSQIYKFKGTIKK